MQIVCRCVGSSPLQRGPAQRLDTEFSLILKYGLRWIDQFLCNAIDIPSGATERHEVGLQVRPGILGSLASDVELGLIAHDSAREIVRYDRCRVIVLGFWAKRKHTEVLVPNWTQS